MLGVWACSALGGRAQAVRRSIVILSVSWLARTSIASAAEPPPEQPSKAAPTEDAEPTALETPVQVHAFVSQGLIKTTKNNYLVQSERGSLEFTEAGVNFTKELTDKLR